MPLANFVSDCSACGNWAAGTIIPALNDHAVEDSVRGNLVDINDLPMLNLTLGADEIHLWHAALDAHSVEGLQHLLSEDELLRADRFHFTRDRNHFAVARGLLRKLLSTYLRMDPNQLRLSYGEMGKPFLAESHASPISFNLAHSGGLAIYAFSLSRELGVDLEFIREELAEEGIAERFFSRREIGELQAVPVELRKQAFFNCWTRKEAYIKARGEGLSMPLDAFDVSLTPGEPAALLKNHADETDVTRWEMRSIPVAAGYVAALVVEGHDWKLKTFGLEPMAGS